MALIMNGMRPNELMVKKLGMFGCETTEGEAATRKHTVGPKVSVHCRCLTDFAGCAGV